jgi:hypothetical protein
VLLSIGLDFTSTVPWCFFIYGNYLTDVAPRKIGCNRKPGKLIEAGGRTGVAD